jgi:hypothetical protein
METLPSVQGTINSDKRTETTLPTLQPSKEDLVLPAFGHKLNHHLVPGHSPAAFS